MEWDSRRLLALCVLIPTVYGMCVREWQPTDAILIIDVQNGFLPQRPIPAGVGPWQAIPEDLYETSTELAAGSLAVTDADVVIPVINGFIDSMTADATNAAFIMASLDWHPSNSCSFCSTGGICTPYGVEECGVSGTANPACPESMALGVRCEDSVSVNDYMVQLSYTQWPHHCIEGSTSAMFDPFLKIPHNALVVKKGFLVHNDSYSAYGGRQSVSAWPFNQVGDTGADLETQDDLQTLIEKNGITRLFVSGIATDYCVKNSVLDSLGLNVAGFSTRPTTLAAPYSVALIHSAVQGVEPAQVVAAVALMAELGAVVIPQNITDPMQALDFYCNFVDAQEAVVIGGSNSGAAFKVGMGIGMTVFGLILVAMLAIYCARKPPKASNYAEGTSVEGDYKPLHDL